MHHESEYTLKDTLSSADQRLPDRKPSRDREPNSRLRAEAADFRSPQTAQQLREKSSSKDTARFNPEDQIYDWSEIGMTRTLEEKPDAQGSFAPQRQARLENCEEGAGTILEEVSKVKQECDRLEGMLSGTRDRLSLLRGGASKPTHDGGIVRLPRTRSPDDKPFFSPHRPPREQPRPEPSPNTKTLDAFRTTAGFARKLAADSKATPDSPPRVGAGERHRLPNPQASLLRTHQSDSKQQQTHTSHASHSQHLGRQFLSDTRKHLEVFRTDFAHTSDFSHKQRGVSQAHKDLAAASHHERNNRSFNFEARDNRDWERDAAPSANLGRRPDASVLFRTVGVETGLSRRAEPRAGEAARSREQEGWEDDYLLRQLIAEKNSVKRRVQLTLAEIPWMERRLGQCAQIVETLHDEQLRQQQRQ